MPEARRKLEQMVIDYLDTKAKNSKVTELTTTKPYATIEEIARNLNLMRTQVSNLVQDLLNQNRVKEFPPSKADGKKFYGSTILPAVRNDGTPPAGDVKEGRSFHRIYGREIAINLVIPFK